MEAILGIVVFIIFITFVIVVVAWAGKKSVGKLQKHYTAIADKFGLQYISETKIWVLITNFPSLVGKLGEYDFRLYSYTSGGKNKTIYSCANITLNKPVPGFSIFKEGFFSKIGKSLGMKDIVVGHQKLDDAFVFRSDNEDFLTNLVGADEISRMLLHLKNEMTSGIYLKNGQLTYTEVNHIHDVKKQARFEKVITLLYAIAKEIESN